MDPARAQELLDRLGTLVRVETRALAAGAGLQGVHLEILRFLARCNRYSDTLASITEWLGATKGTVSQSVGHLVRRRLVVSRRDPTDARVRRFAPTPRGEEILRDASSSEVLAAALATEGRDMQALLEEVLRALQRARGGRTFGVCGTCRHLERLGGERFRCGLTREALRPADTERACREHEPALRS